MGSNDPTALDISVVCIHDTLDDSFKSYTVDQLRNLWPVLEETDIIVTWNGEHFDIPLLNKYYPGDLGKIKSVDMMKEAQAVLGRRLKLDTVAAATLGVPKSGNGIEAVEWWRKGEIDKIVKYCTDDVRITKEIYEYALKYGHIKYRDGGTILELKLDTREWEVPASGAMTFTLPF